MSKNNKMTLEEFIEKQNKINEQQMIINNNMNLQNKKNKKGNLFMVFVCLFVSGISSVLSYTLGASSVGYTPRDSNWKVENTQEAIDDLFNSVGSSLVGSVYSYMGVNVPSGYLACDGTVYNIEDYPRLANHINVNFGSYNYFGGDGTTTFAVPDLRGEFLRGTGTNSHENEGSGANVGVHQSATYHSTATDSQQVRFTHIPTLNADYSKNASFKYTSGSSWSEGGILYTSRPTNTSVLYIIKY